ncbi:hypothetical protein HYH02_007074 [Chlamydomonas schloesseri]|uniref:DUF1232 domain-containing protein n=1 Tax=Chlamydomonas schloesseri TaxID=2026947 RepID=A0A835WIB6_9CHLO|nr:hypothetical protein HYH02_007074 [Chlamydomonas schloesseri]|eukprot:KAG2448047.1 hypothetical protein HYH02_007074 [Chlamydomonas schloesseri]
MADGSCTTHEAPLQQENPAGPEGAMAAAPAPPPVADGDGSSNREQQAPPRKLTLYGRLKKAAKALKHEVLAIYYAMHDPRTPWLPKAIAFVILAYALSPLDLIPDFIPVLGIIDDLILLPALLWLAIWLLPHGVMAEARQRAHTEPFRPGRNWLVATFIAAMWVACLEWLLWFLVSRYGTPVMKQYILESMVGLGAVCAISFWIWIVGKVRKERKKQVQANRAAVLAKAADERGAAAAAAEAMAEAAAERHVDLEEALQGAAAPRQSGGAGGGDDGSDLTRPLLAAEAEAGGDEAV